MLKSLLPINGGTVLSIKRGYNPDFFRKTVEVYRESFIHDPNPIDYNTALTLYILAIILAHVGALLREASEKGQSEYVEVVYMLVDHVLLVAQTLDQLTGSSDWAHKVVGATASLHDLLASAHQGYTISKDKLVKIAESLEKLAKALRNLDIESIEQYSQKLETLAYST